MTIQKGGIIMGKINKKIGGIGVICLFLTIVNMYIIPLIILRDNDA